MNRRFTDMEDLRVLMNLLAKEGVNMHQYVQAVYIDQTLRWGHDLGDVTIEPKHIDYMDQLEYK